MKDLTVNYDLYLDKRTNKKIGKNIILTDEIITNEIEHQYGVIEVIIGIKSGRYGFIRCIPTDEKLFWHSSGLNPLNIDTIFNEGQEISFNIHKRGGLRCAINITLLPTKSLYTELVLKGQCTAIIINTGKLIIIDSNECSLLDKKYWDNKLLLGIYNNTKKNEIKYFPPLSRESISTPELVNHEGVAYQTGEIVTCMISMIWALQRQPYQAFNLTKSILPIQPKIKGTITKIKIKTELLLSMIMESQNNNSNGSSSSSSNTSLNGNSIDVSNMDETIQQLEFVEIKVKLNETNNLTNAITQTFYCLYKEIIISNEVNHIEVGETVEFYPLYDKKLAVDVHLVPKVRMIAFI